MTCAGCASLREKMAAAPESVRRSLSATVVVTPPAYRPAAEKEDARVALKRAEGAIRLRDKAIARSKVIYRGVRARYAAGR